MSLPDRVAEFYTPFEAFAVKKESLMPGQISFGVATNPLDKLARLQVVAERYLGPDTQYITPDDLNADGVYVDKYEAGSVPIVAIKDGVVVGSMRLIPNNRVGVGLPINNEPEIEVDPEWQCRVKGVTFELSQFANLEAERRDFRIARGLIKAYIGIADQIGKPEAAAVVDSRVVRLLNGPYSRFGLPVIGPTKYYLGSNSTPVYINVIDVRESCREHGLNDLADFLEGKKNVCGYEWYVGP